MDALNILVIEIALSILLSLAIIRYERDVMIALLESACPQGGAHFWMKILALLQLLAPLLLVVWRAEADVVFNMVSEFKNALTWMLLGHCIALALIARNVWKAFVAPNLLQARSVK